jgi:hypothetical protein
LDINPAERDHVLHAVACIHQRIPCLSRATRFGCPRGREESRGDTQGAGSPSRENACSWNLSKLPGSSIYGDSLDGTHVTVTHVTVENDDFSISKRVLNHLWWHDSNRPV